MKSLRLIRAASVPRPDLVAKYGSSDHGFSRWESFSLPTGSHAITVTVTDNRSSDQPEVVIFDGFISNHPPVGSLDVVTGQCVKRLGV